jgi:metal-responsive CopG/Arc/MetJ family transcriptional regulator
VKTAISIPDDTFTRADQRARMLGITRSQFYTQAAQRYLDQLDAESLTKQIDEAIDMIGTDESSTLATTAAHRTLEQSGDDEW